MTDTAPTRSPPQILRVPPPARFKWLVIGLIVGMVIVAAIWVAFLIFVRGKGAGLLAGMFLFYAVLFGFVLRRLAVQRRRIRADMLNRFPGIETDPAVAALQAKRARCQTLPTKPAVATETLRAAGIPEPGVARIVCFGAMEMPEVGERRFEPYIITASELLWRQLVFVLLALVLLVPCLVLATGMIPGVGFSFRSFWVAARGFSYLIVMGAVIGLLWVWRTGIRPRYVRAAPGIIQIMEYGIGRRRPLIRSYPMEAGTLVSVFSGHGVRPGALTFVVSRDGHVDTVPVGQMRNRDEAVERIWWALLSTAPIPTMDEEHLVG